jgi:hypothetical protein
MLNPETTGAVAAVKVLVPAVVLGALCALGSMALVEGIERAVGRGALVVQLSVGCAGAVLGAIAGAAQAVVDAIAAGRPRKGE